VGGVDAPSRVYGTSAASSHPAERQEEVHPAGALHAVPQLPVHQMLPGEHQQAEAHGHQQHVEDPRHVVDVQLAAHHLEGRKGIKGGERQREGHDERQRRELLSSGVDGGRQAAYLELIVVADPRQPETLQHVNLVCKETRRRGGEKGGQKEEQMKDEGRIYKCERRRGALELKED